ncbi:hypothetical protein FZC66_09940 [Priestia megaterium]|nr:hypothetical protein FZC66_09940 [Priestia megaterium]
MKWSYFKEVIKQLPDKEQYEKDDLLTDELLVDYYEDIKLYYSPHNEYVNSAAAVVIVGITPGWSQMEYAIRNAKKYLKEEFKDIDILKHVKQKSRFAGSMRKNLISMLDELQLPLYLSANTASELFESVDKQIHSVSLVKYPVMLHEKNYNGHSPPLWK